MFRHEPRMVGNYATGSTLFESISSHRATAVLSPVLETPFSMLMWFYDPVGANNDYLFSFGVGTSTNPTNYIRVNHNGITAIRRDHPDGDVFGDIGASEGDGLWLCVKLIFKADGTTTTQMGGSPWDDGSHNEDIARTYTGANSLGRIYVGANKADNNYWDGYIGPFAIWDRELRRSDLDWISDGYRGFNHPMDLPGTPPWFYSGMATTGSVGIVNESLCGGGPAVIPWSAAPTTTGESPTILPKRPPMWVPTKATGGAPPAATPRNLALLGVGS